MSKIALTPDASGTGTFTIAAPNSNTNRTLTLPDEAGTVLTSASNLAAAQLTGDVAAARITGALNASGDAPIYACRAWVNFNGTGTVAIRASGNVSSITDNGTGDYTVNFTTAIQDANYAVIRSIDFDSTGGGGVVANPEVLSATTGSVRVTAENIAGNRYDVLRYEISIFR
jgi:uncharacterized protein (AIM24 family)